MSETTDVAVVDGGAIVTREYLNAKSDLIRDLYAPKATAVEFEHFMEICALRGLNPLAGQIHAVSRWDGREKRYKVSIQTGIDGLRLIAQRTGEYRGQVGPQWCGADGEWRDVWLDEGYPAAARVGVLRAGWTEPLWGVARWKSYVQTTKDGDVTRMWAQMPDVMLAKVAEALAIRKAFPEELSGLYTGDEMAQADTPQPAPDPTADLIRSRVAELRGGMTNEFLGRVMQEAGITSDALVDDDVYERAKAAMRAAIDARAEDAIARQTPEVKVLTPAQMKGLHAKAKEHGLDHDALHQIAVDLFSVESMKDVPRDGMDAILEAIAAHEVAA